MSVTPKLVISLCAQRSVLSRNILHEWGIRVRGRHDDVDPANRWNCRSGPSGQYLRDAPIPERKILTVHSLRTAPAVLDMVERHLPQGRGSVVLHWFTGSVVDSASGRSPWLLLFNECGDDSYGERSRVVAALPVDRFLIETDGPFTQADDGRPAQPEDAVRTVEAIAQLRETAPDDISHAIASNLEALLHQTSSG